MEDIKLLAHERYPECFGENKYSFNDHHLGGTNVVGDPATYHHPNVWGYLFNTHGIASMVDIGSGFGFAMKFVKDHFPGIRVEGVEGSKKVCDLHLCPKSVVQHDYTTGPVTIDDFDLGWSTEFVEHVEEQYVPNFVETFKCCRYVAFTYAYKGQGGHHHVNENTEEYWIGVMESNGFEYLADETCKLRELAELDKQEVLAQYGTNFIFHFQERGLFFKNKNRK